MGLTVRLGLEAGSSFVGSLSRCLITGGTILRCQNRGAYRVLGETTAPLPAAV